MEDISMSSSDQDNGQEIIAPTTEQASLQQVPPIQSEATTPSSEEPCSRCTRQLPATELVDCIESGHMCKKCASHLELRMCNCCKDYIDVGIAVKLNLSCSHYHCASCFEECWKQSLANRFIYPPKCCGKPITMQSKLLDANLFAKHLDKNDEFSAERPVCCATKGCAKFLGNAYDGIHESFFCGDCDDGTCTDCYQLISEHNDGEGSCPDRDPLIVDGKAMIHCPDCHTPSERHGGHCNQLECGGCMRSFCALCGVVREEGQRCEYGCNNEAEDGADAILAAGGWLDMEQED